MNPDFIVLAAGKGQRMLGTTPKVLLPLAGKPMAQHLLDTVAEIKGSRQIIVVGNQAEEVKKNLTAPRNTIWIKQRRQLGTGHAVKTAILGTRSRSRSMVVVLYGDVPLVRSKTIKNLIKMASMDSLAVLTFRKVDPKGYGRIIRNPGNQIEAIIEEKDATQEQRKITEVNSGILAIKSSYLKKLLPQIKNKNVAKEYYLTDIVSLAKGSGIKVKALLLENSDEVMGANTPMEFQGLERACQKNKATRLVESGVRVADILRIDVRGSLEAGKGSFIDVNNVFEGKVVLGKKVTIGQNCYLKDSTIGSGTTLLANTFVEDSKVGEDCTIGPFTRLRGGTELESSSELGNFVEANRSKVGRDSKAKHLTYLGDATLGQEVNIGAGTITCNFDGEKKHKTKIADKVFIGSNTSLVAPISLGKKSYTGAGSVITKNVPAGNLAIGRARQNNMKGKGKGKK